VTSSGPDLAAELASALPPYDLERLIGAAGEGARGLADLRARTASALLRSAISSLLPFAERPEWLAGLLAGAVAAQRRRADVDLQVVWTGPESEVDTGRLTAPVVLGMVAEAQREILLVSFAADSAAALQQPLAEAVGRGVDLTMVLERTEDNPGFFGREAFRNLPARRLAWSTARPAGAALHAKLLVVDRRIALVGSANFTGRAMDQNLECGVVIRGGRSPAAIRDHIFGLWHAGVLEQVGTD